MAHKYFYKGTQCCWWIVGVGGYDVCIEDLKMWENNLTVEIQSGSTITHLSFWPVQNEFNRSHRGRI